MTLAFRISLVGSLLSLLGCGSGSGHMGTSGAAGASATGAAGTGSATGAAGDTGAAGATGAAGTTGAAGDEGVAGTTGAAGMTNAAGTTGTAGTTGAAGAAGTTGGAGTTGAAGLVWPNATSSANSDQWLMDHHTEITEIHPRFLVIDFANGNSDAAVMAAFQKHRDAFMVGSTYHGYSDPSAKPFVFFELAKYVNLKDNPIPAGWTAPNSTKMPRRNGGIDFGKLFTQEYADYYAIPDPGNAAHNLTLCELFQKGIVNDIFVAFTKTGTDGNVPEIVEYKQSYDRNDVKRVARFDPYAGNGSWDDLDLPFLTQCGRSVRIDFLEMNGNFTNAMEVHAHNFEHIGQRAVPRFYEMFKPFGNFDIGTRFKTPFGDWYSCAYTGNTCLTYPDANSVTYTINGVTATLKPFNQGCGNAHFPPNARGQYDKSNPGVVSSTCEHYGLHDGPGGADLQTPYSVTNTDRYKGTPTGDSMRGGGWFLYWLQSWPGYGNKAKMADGSPMKNWWVYLYY